jgi:opacity protein-like surface antigen
MSHFTFCAAIFFLLAVAVSGSAAAEETAQPAGWQFGLDLYLWMPGMGGETTAGDTIDVPFDTILENLDFGYMSVFHARKGKLHLSTDVIYMYLEGDNSNQVALPDGNQLKLDATVKFQSWIVNPAIGYSLMDTEKIKVEGFAGIRYLYMKPEIELDYTGVYTSRQNNISDSVDMWDGIIGVRGEVSLIKNLYVPYYLDMGTGDSDFTWQIMAGLGYRIDKSMEVVAAYRYLEWKFEDSTALDSLDISGPLIGLRIRF